MAGEFWNLVKDKNSKKKKKRILFWENSRMKNKFQRREYSSGNKGNKNWDVEVSRRNGVLEET